MLDIFTNTMKCFVRICECVSVHVRVYVSSVFRTHTQTHTHTDIGRLPLGRAATESASTKIEHLYFSAQEVDLVRGREVIG